MVEFRGRGETIQVFPLSFAEFATLRADTRDFHSMLREYLMFGGLPECVLKTDESLKKEYLASLCKTIYLKDVQDRNKIRNTALLENLFDVVMSNVGGLMNPTKFANTIQTVAGIPANHAALPIGDQCIDEPLVFDALVVLVFRRFARRILLETVSMRETPPHAMRRTDVHDGRVYRRYEHIEDGRPAPTALLPTRGSHPPHTGIPPSLHGVYDFPTRENGFPPRVRRGIAEGHWT